MGSFWALPLRRQLFVAILLLLVPVLLAVFWSGLVTMRERRVELGSEAQMISRTTAAYIARDLTMLDQMVQRMSMSAEMQSLDPAAADAMFPRFLGGRSAVHGLTLLSADGTRLAAAGLEADAEQYAPWARQVVGRGRRLVTPIQVTPAGQQYFAVIYPISMEERPPVAALAVSVGLERIQDAFASLPVPPGSVVLVTEPDGRILARSLDRDRYVGTMRSRPPAEMSEPPYRAPGVDGIDRMYGEAAVDGTPWTVAVGLPTALAFERAAAIWSRSFAVLALGLAGWLVVAIVLSRRLADAVSHLDGTAQRIAAGDFSPMERKPMLSREFAELQNAFDAMLRRFNTTRQMLDAQMAEERRIRQELESLQGQVIRQERLAAVGQLVSGVAHEINNPLQAILGFAELLQMQGDVPDAVKGDLRLIQKESARACGIIRNLALFARQQPGAAEPVRMTDVISSIVELRQRRLESERIELQVEDRSTEYVRAVLTELQQVVLNFTVNAEQAILQSGRLPGRLIMRTYDTSDRVVLEVEDTGPGVAPEDEAKLFQPFFTTKPVGQGTGLGLSISYGIIDSLGGQIGYRRAGAGGSIFYFALPIASGDV